MFLLSNKFKSKKIFHAFFTRKGGVSKGTFKSLNFGIGSKDSKNFVSVGLKYFDGQPVIKNLERISRPGLRKYEGVKDLKEVNAGLGIYILTTNQGLMTDKTARSQNIGGEVYSLKHPDSVVYRN